MSGWERNRRGQTTVETILLFPLYFMLVFGLIQIGQLAIALMVANYSASAIARQAVADNSTAGGTYLPKFEKLMSVGMRNGNVVITSQSGLLRNLKVEACAEVVALPFVDFIVGGALGSSLGQGTAEECSGITNMAYNRGVFVIHGEANARMNYKP